jgi:thiol-disulfide isomerase/thioredoxin
VVLLETTKKITMRILLCYLFIFSKTVFANDSLMVIYPNVENSTLILEGMVNAKEKVNIDTVLFEKSKAMFTKTGIETNILYRLKMNNQYISEWFFWCENMTVNISAPFQLKFSNSETNSLYQFYMEELVNPLRMLFVKKSILLGQKKSQNNDFIKNESILMFDKLINIYQSSLKTLNKDVPKNEFFLYLIMHEKQNIEIIESKIIDEIPAKYNNHPYLLYFLEKDKELIKFEIGDKIPKITENIFKGGKIDNAIFKQKKLTIIDFWGTWCGPCIKSIPNLVNINQKYKKDINILSIANENEENNLKFADFIRKYNMDWLHVRLIESQKEPSIITNMRINSYPTIFVIDQEGKILFKKVGISENDDLDDFLKLYFK